MVLEDHLVDVDLQLTKNHMCMYHNYYDRLKASYTLRTLLAYNL